MNFNKVFLVGNLTRDPESRYTPNGTAITSFGLAVNRKYKSGDDWKTEASFFDIEVWGKQAENCAKYLNKGSGVLVEGYLKQERWEDQQTGDKRSKVKVVANSVQFMLKKQDTQPNNEEQKEQYPEEDGNLPF